MKESSSQLSVKLLERSGANAGQAHRLPIGESILGRDPGLELHLPYADISRRHARFVVSWDSVEVEDLGSKNGIWCEGQRVDGRQAIRDGQALEIGGIQFLLSHPSQRIDGALRAGGESTVTLRSRDGHREGEREAPPGLLFPLSLTLGFAGLVILALLFS